MVGRADSGMRESLELCSHFSTLFTIAALMLNPPLTTVPPLLYHALLVDSLSELCLLQVGSADPIPSESASGIQKGSLVRFLELRHTKQLLVKL